MTTCYDGHKQIIFDGIDCPLCRAQAVIDKLEHTVSGLRFEVDDLEKDLSEAHKSNET